MTTKIFLSTFLVFFSFLGYSFDLIGNWSGILIPAGDNYAQAKVIYINFSSDNQVEGTSRIEILDNSDFAVKEFEGTLKEGQIEIVDKTARRSSNTRNAPECKLQFNLKYDNVNAYLSGNYSSQLCREEQGKVVLFRSDYSVSLEKEPIETHLWVHRFIRNYKKGYPSPEILKKEQQNFKFQPIYFDHDQSEIKPEFYDYLNRMARILDAIHDLRVEIIGHTDAVGTDGYNIGLSERRADAIRDYFKGRGVDIGKLEIDFKGKREPVADNNTREGKQKNRRVVFKFI